MPLKFTVGVPGLFEGLGIPIGSGLSGSAADGFGFSPTGLPAALSSLYRFIVALKAGSTSACHCFNAF